MPQQLAKAHLVIGRAGASTVAELSAMGRPAVLVPYPHALDHDQAANAQSFCEAGGGSMFREADLSAEILAGHLKDMMINSDRLEAAASAAKGQGRVNAVASLADLVEKMAG
jgi:UDP-N-acetylglucosamine--N-acetylmuramyl-(pentapeptide) pyrophosphoryl-undecaprenol N-acetylglucosamine transferase